MKNSRFRENEVENWLVMEPTTEDPVLVVCRECGNKALIFPVDSSGVKLVCTGCGHTKNRGSEEYAALSGRRTCQGTDKYFGLKLWFQATVKGNLLWACNIGHLNLIESYVSSHLRERTKNEESGWSNAALTSRLPLWIKSGKNRDAVLKTIDLIRKKS